jgi:hypothetical protein
VKKSMNTKRFGGIAFDAVNFHLSPVPAATGGALFGKS